MRDVVARRHIGFILAASTATGAGGAVSPGEILALVLAYHLATASVPTPQMTRATKTSMTETERIVRIFHASWDMRGPERGTEVIAEDCHFEDMARGELLRGRDGYKRDYLRWREAFPDGEVKICKVIVQDAWAVGRS